MIYGPYLVAAAARLSGPLFGCWSGGEEVVESRLESSLSRNRTGGFGVLDENLRLIPSPGVEELPPAANSLN